MNLRSRLRPIAAALMLSFLCAGAPARADQTTDTARKLLESKEAKQAYELLAPLASERAGDPEFDLLLGTAAVDTGRNTEAVFALERVLAVQPDNVAARAEIGRAYFNLKETAAAKREFDNVKRSAPPAPVVSTLDKYLAEIERIDSRSKASLRGYVEGFGGSDSNVNSATADRTVAVPVFGGAIFALAPGGSSLNDSFLGLQAGLSFRVPQTPMWALVGGATVNRRWNTQFNEFDTGFFDFSFGGQRRKDKDTFTILGQYNDFHVQNPAFPNVFRNAVGGSAQWLRDIDLRNQIGAYLQMAQVSYPDQPIRDANRWVVGGNVAHAYRNGIIAFATAYLGQEVATNRNFAYVGHNLSGARGGVEIPASDAVRFFGNLGYERRNFDSQEPLFLATRHDDQYTAAIGLHFVPADQWRVTPQVYWLHNVSSIPLSSFHRNVAEVRIRRDF